MTTKPRLLLDMDGPICDFDAYFYDLCKIRNWPMHGGEVHVGNLCREHRFATDCLEPEHGRRARDFVNNTRWFRDLPIVHGAEDGVERLAEHFDVWICTKPLEANVFCRDDKAAWVRRVLGADWEKRLIIAPDKSVVDGDVLLDDAPKGEWLQGGRKTWEPVIFTTAWNGMGSEWEGYPHWDWDGDVRELVEYADGVRRRKVREGEVA